MRERAMAFVLLSLCTVAACSDDGGTPDAGGAGSAGTAGTAGVSGVGGMTAGTNAAGMGGRAGSAGSSGTGMLGSDVCARSPVDSCDLLTACASVKARKNCGGPVIFVACAPKQSGCAQSASYCAKDATGTEWFFPTSCGKAEIQKGSWTIEAQCGCSESDAGADDAGL